MFTRYQKHTAMYNWSLYERIQIRGKKTHRFWISKSAFRIVKIFLLTENVPTFEAVPILAFPKDRSELILQPDRRPRDGGRRGDETAGRKGRRAVGPGRNVDQGGSNILILKKNIW